MGCDLADYAERIARPFGSRLHPRQSLQVGADGRGLYVGATTADYMTLTEFFPMGETSVRLSRAEAVRLQAAICDWLSHDSEAY